MTCINMVFVDIAARHAEEERKFVLQMKNVSQIEVIVCD